MESGSSINWSLCCLCQVTLKGANLRSTDDGWRTIAKQLIKFKQVGTVLRGPLDTFDKDKDLYEYLKKNKAYYHRNCHDKYNDIKFNRLKEKQMARNQSGQQNGT